ncbi:VOC family protein [Nocardioides sp. YIM 152315]|uniref:VOC family protein n=1 Tax=Nocardioides sp. YIM 152315 TaxID=3031760 RepID=UPI0023DC561E|nr:VOC family protein [Nocardioides sp. YIM 152315]MDF1603337.1 VOC family protein [Nocardioides sp. YIM 152315]
MSTTPFWVSAFLDVAPGAFDRGVEFWRGVTGYAVSDPRGERDHFVTLAPPDGDDYLRLQHLADGPGGLHLDLHVENPTIAAEAAVELGAHVLMRHEDGYVVVRSPGGFVFCFVRAQASRGPAAATWPDGHRSRVDQVCLDIAPSAYDVEVAFWPSLTGWDHDPDVSREFARLHPPGSMPLLWLVQRLDDERSPVSAHLDLSTDDHEAEIARHVELGATVVSTHDHWTVLTDPVGTTYCITRRTPVD